MHKLRSSGGRRGIGVHVVRIAAFSAALTALTGIVVADVIAAEPEEPAVASITGDEWRGEADVDERGPVLLAVVVPDVVPAPMSDLPELEALPEPPKPKKKRRPSKMKFGRFEGY
jgi:hypothetical protein